jgi:hypothetical protein
MHINHKKVLAREFIFFVVGVLTVIFFYIGILIYNQIILRKIKKNENSIGALTVLRDSLAKPYNDKLEKEVWFYEECKKNMLVTRGNRLDLWIRLNKSIKNGDLVSKYDNSENVRTNLKSLGFETVSDLKHFINQNTIHAPEVNDKLKANEINDRLTIMMQENYSLSNSALDESEQIQTLEFVLLISFSVLFLLRWLYYGCKWSIIILRQ